MRAAGSVSAIRFPHHPQCAFRWLLNAFARERRAMGSLPNQEPSTLTANTERLQPDAQASGISAIAFSKASTAAVPRRTKRTWRTCSRLSALPATAWTATAAPSSIG